MFGVESFRIIIKPGQLCYGLNSFLKGGLYRGLHNTGFRFRAKGLSSLLGVLEWIMSGTTI